MKNGRYAGIAKNMVVVAVALVVLLVILSGCSYETFTENSSGDFSKTVRYTLHIGLNDKDTYKQEISDEKAMQIVSDTSLKYTDGFTVYQCQGMYKDSKGAVTRESTLVVEFYTAGEEQVKSVMDELLASLNQESILFEKADVTYRFYGQKEKGNDES